MKTTLTLLTTWTLGALVLPATVARAQSPLTITDVSGNVHIQQRVPCGDPVDVTLPIQDGLIQITPRIVAADITENEVLFDLTRLDLSLSPFRVERTCSGISALVDFRKIDVQLAKVLRFAGEETGGLESRLYRFRIPKEQFLIVETVEDNLDVPQPEKAFQRPSEDVTGLIDLRHRTFQIHVALADTLRFRAGCVGGGRCLIDQPQDGTQTSDVLGVTIPGTTPPTVACSPVNRLGNGFKVFATDDAEASPIIRLGSYALTNGEVIQLEQTGKPGVRQVDPTAGGFRHFLVGKGEAFIIATDASGLSAIAYCR